MKVTYHHGEHRIGGLKTIRAFFPEITVPLNGDDVAADSVSGFGDDDVGGGIGGKGLGDAEAADAAADNDAVDGGGIELGGGFRRRRGGFLGDGAADARVRGANAKG